MGKKGRAIIVIKPDQIAVFIIKKDSVKKELKLPPTILTGSTVKDPKKATKLIVEFFADAGLVNKKVLVYLSSNIPAESNYPNLVYSCIEKVESDLVDVLSLKQEATDAEIIKNTTGNWQRNNPFTINYYLIGLIVALFLVSSGFGGYIYYHNNYPKNPPQKVSNQMVINTPLITNLDGPIAQESTSSALTGEHTSTATAQDMAVLVLNGSGQTGQAAQVKSKLQSLGIVNVSTGNNSDANVSQTELMVKDDLPSEQVNNIQQALAPLFNNPPKVMPLNTDGKYQVIIVTGD